MVDLTPSDRDLLARTVATEAAGDPMGQIAVAASIRNRLASGRYGNSVADIVKAPLQYEVWGNGKAANLPTDSTAYQNAGRIVDAIAGGLPDPTGGATHFYSPKAQAQLAQGDNRPLTPNWAKNPTGTFGGNVFFAPEGRVNYQPDPNDAATPAQAAQSPDPQTITGSLVANAQPAKAATNLSALKAFGLDVGDEPSSTSPASPQVAVPTKSAPADLSALKAFGLDVDDKPAASAQPTAALVPTTSSKTGTDLGAQAALRQNAVNGVPLVGTGLTGIADYIGSHIGSMISGQPVADVLAQGQATANATSAAHPLASTTGRIAGAVGGSIPMMAAAPAAFGMGAGPIGLRMIGSAVGGSAVGAGDAYVRGANPLTGAEIGAVGGAAGPLVGKAIGAGANALFGKAAPIVPGLSNANANLLLQSADYGGGVGAIQQQAARYGANAMLPDLGPSFKGMAQELAVSGQGGAKDTIMNAFNNRAGAPANARLSNDVLSAIGGSDGPTTVTNQIKEARSAFNADAYPQVHANAPDVDVSSTVNAIDNQLKTAVGSQKDALQYIRGMLVKTPASVAEDGTQIPEVLQDNSQILHNTREEIDKLINYGKPDLGIAPGAVSRKSGSVGMMRNSLDNDLKTQVPGMADADAQSSAMAENANAFQRGQRIYENGREDLTPQEYHDDFITQRPNETNEAFQQRQYYQKLGAAAETQRLLGANANDPAALRRAMGGADPTQALEAGTFQPGVGWNTNKLASTFGADAANKLVNAVDREGAFAANTTDISKGAQTAFRQSGKTLVQQTPTVDPVSMLPATKIGLATQAARKLIYKPVVNALLGTNYAVRDPEIANALTAQGPQLNDLLTALQARGASKAQISAAAQALQRGTTGTGNLLTSGVMSNINNNNKN